MRPGEDLVFLVQPVNLFEQRVAAAVVLDHVVGDRETLFARRLSSKDALRCLTAPTIPPHEPVDLGFRVAVDDEYAIDEQFQWRLGQQRHNDDLVFAACGIRLPDGLFTNNRMQYCFEQLSRIVDGKDQLTQCRPVQRPGLRQYAIAEGFSDFLQRRLAWRHNVARDYVGVDDGNAASRKRVCNCRLAACDAAGQANSERGIGVQCSGSAVGVRRKFPGRRP